MTTTPCHYASSTGFCKPEIIYPEAAELGPRLALAAANENEDILARYNRAFLGAVEEWGVGGCRTDLTIHLRHHYARERLI